MILISCRRNFNTLDSTQEVLFNETLGAWTLRVTDVTSGRSAKATFTVKKMEIGP